MLLATSRLTLREATAHDAREIAGYQRDPRYLEHYPVAPDAERITQLSREWASESPRLNFQLIVTLSEGGLVIGCAGLRQKGQRRGEAEIGIEFNPHYWGAGYAKEAITKLIEFAREDLGIHRLIAVTTSENTRAESLVRSFGFLQDSSANGEVRYHLAVVSA